MMKRLAVRNLRLCTKDCICLYVCPTGASDTEDSIIDPLKCIGCGACAEACPSKAISLVPLTYPDQQVKDNNVLKVNKKLSQSKAKAEKISHDLASKTKEDSLRRLLKAIERSSRLMNEDVMRESGYMLPQSLNTRRLIEDLLDKADDRFPKIEAQRLLDQGLKN